MRNRTLLVLASLGTMNAAVFAQPKLVSIPINSDLATNGNVVSGYIYDGALKEHVPFTFTRGVGFSRIPGIAPGGGSALCVSSNGSVLASGMDNLSNWGDLNCFTGYTSTGAPRPATTPCSYPSIAHRYTQASGWVNAGSLARTLDSATGRWVGGTRCDSTVNTVYDLSGDGRYIVGGAYSANAFTSTGGIGLGLCGDFFAFRYDSQTGAFDKLPTVSGTTRADRVSADGSVVTGYDLSGVTRRLVVWADGTETILDPNGYFAAEIAGNGTAVAAGASLNLSFSQYGIYGMALVKWNRNGNAWVPQNLGVPADWIDSSQMANECTGLAVRGISTDGNTIVGDAYYGGDPGRLIGIMRPFIWRATLNGGVPMDLEAYLLSLDPSGASTGGARLAYVTGLSGDGNSILVACSDARNFCEAGQTLETGFAALISLDGSQTQNEPPRIAVQPVDSSTRCPWPRWGEVMNVIAGGSWPLNYQWQREDPSNPGQWINLQSACSNIDGNGFPPDASWEYEGVNGMQLRINVVNRDASKDGFYRCVISNAYGSVTSAAAEFRFAGAINPQGPYDASGCTASPAVFSVTPVDGGVEYTWQYCTSPENDTWISMGEGINNLPTGTITVTGVHASTVSIDPGTLAGGSQHLFRCRIADSCNSLETGSATLTVGSPCGRADLGQQGGIPAPCGDGLLDNNDFIAFIDFFFFADPRADQGVQGGLPGSDGLFDNNDFIAFIDNFFVGCNS